MNQPRYEFRIFGSNLDQPRRHLEQTATRSNRETREDVYLFVKHDPTQAVKLRGKTSLDYKRLISTEGEFEKWEPCGKIDFPVTGSKLSEWLKDIAEVALNDGLLSANDVMSALAHSSAKDMVRVKKDRTNFQMDQVKAEFTQLLVEDKTEQQTIAIESTNLTALTAARDYLGLSGSINTSYPAWLSAYSDDQDE